MTKLLSTEERFRLGEHYLFYFRKNIVTPALDRISSWFVDKQLRDPQKFHVPLKEENFRTKFFEMLQSAEKVLSETIAEEANQARERARKEIKLHKKITRDFTRLMSEVDTILKTNFDDVKCTLLRSWQSKSVCLTLYELMEQDPIINGHSSALHKNDSKPVYPLYLRLTYELALRYAVALYDLYKAIVDVGVLRYIDLYLPLMTMIDAQRNPNENPSQQLLEYMAGRWGFCEYMEAVEKSKQNTIVEEKKVMKIDQMPHSAIDLVRIEGSTMTKVGRRFAERHPYKKIVVMLSELHIACCRLDHALKVGNDDDKRICEREVQARINFLPPPRNVRRFVERFSVFIRCESTDYRSRIGFDLFANDNVEYSLSLLNDFMSTYEVIYPLRAFGSEYEKTILNTIDQQFISDKAFRKAVSKAAEIANMMIIRAANDGAHRVTGIVKVNCGEEEEKEKKKKEEQREEKKGEKVQEEDEVEENRKKEKRVETDIVIPLKLASLESQN